MKDLIWSNTLSVQVEEIDEDHRKLIDLFNLLNHSVADGESAVYIAAILEELVCCTAWHFKHEERLMIKHKYDAYEAHKAEHDELIKSAKELQQELLQEGKSISSKDIEYLEYWLTGHIFGAYIDLGSYLGEVL